MTAININGAVQVKLNDHGRKILRNYYDGLTREIQGVNPKMAAVTPSAAELDGNFHLWELMSIFGPHCSTGSEPPFDNFVVPAQ